MLLIPFILSDSHNLTTGFDRRCRFISGIVFRKEVHAFKATYLCESEVTNVLCYLLNPG